VTELFRKKSFTVEGCDTPFIVNELPIRFRVRLLDTTTDIDTLDILKMAKISKEIYSKFDSVTVNIVASEIIKFTYEYEKRDTEEQPTDKEIEESEYRLMDDIAMMIRHNHTNALDYPISFFYTCIKEIWSSERDRVQMNALSSRVAQSSDEYFEKFMETEDEAEDENDNLRGLMNKGL